MFDFGLLEIYHGAWPIYDDCMRPIYHEYQTLLFRCGCEGSPMLEFYAKGLWLICNIRCKTHVWKCGELIKC